MFIRDGYRLIERMAIQEKPGRQIEFWGMTDLMNIQQTVLRLTISHLGEVKAVQVHDFIPGFNEIIDKFFLGILTSINFCQGSELGI